MNTAELQPQQLRQFRSDGYLALPGFVKGAELEELQRQVANYIGVVAPTMPAEEVFYEDKKDRSSLKQIQRMFEYDDYFRQLMVGSRFEQIAAILLQQRVRPVNLQYFNKPPGLGKPTPPHQDGFYFMLQPNDALTMWLALDSVDEENGCVRYVRGSHLYGLRPHSRTQTLGFSQGISDFDSVESDSRDEVPMPANPGDLLVHHALTIHRADSNRSAGRNRQSLGLIYYSTAAKEDAEKQRRHAALLDELRSSGKV